MKKLLFLPIIILLASCSDEIDCSIYNVGGSGANAQVLVKNTSNELIVFTIETDFRQFPGSGINPDGSASFAVLGGTRKYQVLIHSTGQIIEGVLEVKECATTEFSY